MSTMAFVLVFTAVGIWAWYRITQTGRNQIILNNIERQDKS